MAKFLADENVPGVFVQAARLAGYDIQWVAEISPSARDETILAMAQIDGRVLLTFDRDFGELAFRAGKAATHGVLLFRPRQRSLDAIIRFALPVLSQSINWEGKFCVAKEGSLRVVELPK